MPGVFYVGDNDVHQYTSAVLECLRAKFPPNHCVFASPRRQWWTLCAWLRELFSRHRSLPHLDALLGKMTSRGGNNYTCPDTHMNIATLLELTASLAKSLHADDEFMETVHEMGGHCPQGDSHRLFSLYVALSRSRPN